MLEIIIVAIILIFGILYRVNNGESVYDFFTKTIGKIYEKYAPYTFKMVREKTKELGLEYTPRQYIIQILAFAFLAGLVSYLYFYSIVITVIYIVVAIMFVPYLAYLRCNRVYSEFIFEQIQVYTTNVIMEFNTTQSFVKALEGVRDSGVLEDPILTDVKNMISMAYKNGTIDESIKYFNKKYNFYIVKNMHELFLQITKEGSRDAGESLENMLLDIDMLVESVYRDRLDRKNFHRKFITFGIVLYFLIAIMQYLLGRETYIDMVDLWYVALLLHAILITNTVFILGGEKYYNEDVGAE